MAQAAAEPRLRSLVAVLDQDHVMDLARAIVDENDELVRSFFAPEAVDLHGVRALAHGLRTCDGVDVRLARELKPAEIARASVIVFRRGEVGAGRIAACPRLRLVQRLGAGTDTIDLEAARARNVAVSCLPRRSLALAAEHALMLMLALSKRLLAADLAVRYDRRCLAGSVGDVAYNWPGLTGIDGLQGRTLGIVGMGEVGRLVAQRAAAFGMRIVYADRAPLPDALARGLSARQASLGALLQASDIVSLHVPNTPDNRCLVGRAELGLMHAGAFLVNTSRGGIVDEDALYEALAAQRIAGAALDVHAAEPRGADDRFCGLPNVVMTPHVAGGSRLGVLPEIAAIFDNLRAALQGLPPPHAVVGTAP